MCTYVNLDVAYYKCDLLWGQAPFGENDSMEHDDDNVQLVFYEHDSEYFYKINIVVNI